MNFNNDFKQISYWYSYYFRIQSGSKQSLTNTGTTKIGIQNAGHLKSSEIKTNENLFCISLDLHYLCPKYADWAF
jgi:hypothetical protein